MDLLIEHKVDCFDENDIAPNVVALRKILAENETPAVEPVGARTDFIEWLTQAYGRVQNETLLGELTWIVTNLTSGSHDIVERFIKANFFEVFAQRLEGPREETTLLNMIWALGNVVGDGPEGRDFILNSFIADNVIQTVLNIFPSLKPETQDIFWWFLSNCLRGKPHPPLAPTKQIAQIAIEAITTGSLVSMRKAIPRATWSTSVEPGSEQDRLTFTSSGLIDVWWALSYASDSEFHAKVMLTRPAFVNVLFYYLSQAISPTCGKLLTPILRVLGNLVASADPAVLFSPVYRCFEILFAILDSPQKSNQHREVLWILSNIIADGNGVTHVPNHINSIRRVLSTFLDHRDHGIRKEACWIVGNLISSNLPQELKASVIETLKHTSSRAKTTLEEMAQSCTDIREYLPEIMAGSVDNQNSHEPVPNVDEEDEDEDAHVYADAEAAEMPQPQHDDEPEDDQNFVAELF